MKTRNVVLVAILLSAFLFSVFTPQTKAKESPKPFVCKGVIPSMKTAPKKISWEIEESLALGFITGQSRDSDTFISGELRVLVLTQGFAGVENPDLTDETLDNAIFSGQYSLATFIDEVSGGKVSIPSSKGKIMNKWYVGDGTSSYGDLLLKDGVNWDDFDRFVIIMAGSSSSYAGFAGDVDAYMFSASVDQPDQRHHVLYHEFGHTLGPSHAGGMMLEDKECNFCQDIIDGYLSEEDKCQGYEYRDYLDSMGYGHGHYSGYAKWRTLGWLDDDQVQIVAGEKIGEVGLTNGNFLARD